MNFVNISTDVCAVCEHLIAEHQYEFRIDGEYQVNILTAGTQ